MFTRDESSRQRIENQMIEDMHKMEREIAAEQRMRRIQLQAVEDLRERAAIGIRDNSAPNSPNAPKGPEHFQERKTSMFLQFGKAAAKCYGTMIACSCACEEKKTVEPAKPR